MNRRIAVILPAAILALMGSARGEGVDAYASAPAHSGFFFSADVGPADTQFHLSGPRDQADTHSGGAELDLRFGYALTPQLVLSGDLGGIASVVNPHTTLDGARIHASSDYRFSAGLLGVGLTWYTDGNIFIGATVGTGSITLHYSNADHNSGSGFAMQARAGKEWSVGGWGMGVVGGVSYVTAGVNADFTVSNSAGQSRTAHFDHADATAVFIGFSATFN